MKDGESSFPHIETFETDIIKIQEVLIRIY